MASTVGKRVQKDSIAPRILSASLACVVGDPTKVAVGAGQVKTVMLYTRKAWERKASSAGKGDGTGI